MDRHHRRGHSRPGAFCPSHPSAGPPRCLTARGSGHDEVILSHPLHRHNGPPPPDPASPQGQVVRKERQCRGSTRPVLILSRLAIGWQKNSSAAAFDYDPERVRLDIAVAVKLCFKYQGLRSLLWGVRRSLATNPGFGSADLLGQTATVFLRRSRLSLSPSPSASSRRRHCRSRPRRPTPRPASQGRAGVR